MFIEQTDSVPPVGEENNTELRLTATEVDGVRRVVERMVPGQDVSDVVQIALYSAYRYRSTFRGEAKFTTWLHRIAVNAARMHLRSMRTKARLSECDVDVELIEVPQEEDSAEEAIDRQRSTQRVLRAFRRLEKNEREAFRSFFLLDLSCDETARRLGISLGAAKSRIFRALNHVRKILEQEDLANEAELLLKSG